MLSRVTTNEVASSLTVTASVHLGAKLFCSEGPASIVTVVGAAKAEPTPLARVNVNNDVASHRLCDPTSGG